MGSVQLIKLVVNVLLWSHLLPFVAFDFKLELMFIDNFYHMLVDDVDSALVVYLVCIIVLILIRWEASACGLLLLRTIDTVRWVFKRPLTVPEIVEEIV